MSEELKKSPEEWVEHYQSHYIATLTAETASRIIKNDMTNVARSCISIGFHLKAVRDRELFREMGYDSLWNYAADQFGLSMSSASRYIAINDQFSVGGNTPQLQPEYRNFSKSQLQEMLNMSPEQIEQVTEGMTVKEIRKLKRPEELPREEVFATSQQNESVLDSASCQPEIGQCIRQEGGTPEEEQHEGQKLLYNLPLREYSEDSLIARSGCGTHNCFTCHQSGCNIRQEFCYCVEAPCGSPFPCEMLDKVPELQKEKLENCQFLDDSLAYHREEDGEAVPCCKDCENLCTFACMRTKKALEKMGLPAPGESNREDLEEDDDELLCDDCRNASVPTGDPDLCANCSDGGGYEPFPEEKQGLSDMDLLRSMLREENNQLSEYLKVDKVEKLPEDMIRKKKLMVGALAGMLCDLEEGKESEDIVQEQPELPLMKNNDQRKEWLRSYHDWGLWYEDTNIGAKYYKYDFENGARLIAETYVISANKYCPEHETCYLHLVGGPEPPKHPKYGDGKWTRHDRYNRYQDSETELVEFLKAVQKN